jgi:recombination protein RecA
LDIRRGEAIKDGTNILGNRTTIKVVKNKVAPPFKTAEVDIIYGKGISKIGEIVDIAVQEGIINKAGSWFSYNDQKIAQGRENAKEYLVKNPQIAEEIENKIRSL